MADLYEKVNLQVYRNVESTLCMLEESKKFDLENKISILMNESKFQEALKLLEQLQPIQNDKAKKINTQLMISQCQMKLAVPHSSAKDLEKLITSSPVLSEDLKESANKNVKQKIYVRAFLYYFLASKFYKGKYLGDDAVQGIKACVQAVEMFVEEMIKQDDGKKIVAGYVIPTLKEVTDDLSKIPNADPRYQVTLQAWCLQSIGLCYKHCEDYQQFANNVESAIQLLQRELKEDVDKYRVYGICLHRSGEAHEKLDEKGQAMDLYESAIKAKNNANDWPSVQSKFDSNELSQEKLKIMVEFYEAKLDVLKNVMKRFEYSEALNLIREIEPLLRRVEEKIKVQLTKIEYHMMMEQHCKVFREMDELTRLTLSSKRTAGDVMKMAENDITAELYISGFLRYFSACKLYKERSAGNGIRACMLAVRQLVKKMIEQDEKMKKIVTDYIIPALEEVTDDVRTILNSNREVQVELQAWCLYIVGFCYGYCKKFERHAEFTESAIELMKKQLKDDAEKYSIIGYCYHSTGVAYSSLNQKEKSKEMYRKAVDVYNKVTDWLNEEKKRDAIMLTKKNLKFL